jgi:hypothetical protein
MLCSYAFEAAGGSVVCGSPCEENALQHARRSVIKTVMRFAVVLLLGTFVLFTSCASGPKKETKRTIWSWVLNPFGGSGEKPVMTRQKLEVAMTVEPLPLKLSETRQLKVTLSVTNRSRKFVQLEFPTTQRIEVVIRDKAGQMVTQWSEDQVFANVVSYVAINPGERLEYNASISTRDLTAGQNYAVEAFLPNYEELKIEKRILPEK